MDNLRVQAQKWLEPLSDIFTRMDADRDLANLEKYVLKDTSDPPRKIANAVSVTLNDPANFAFNVESTLNAAAEQVSVTSMHKRFDTAYVEEFIRAAFKSADKLLPVKDMFALNPFLDQQATRRGRMATRCLFLVKDGELVPDLTPMDTRFYGYCSDARGISGRIYQTTRNITQIQAEYPDADLSDVKNTSAITVEDIWTREVNETWIAGKLARSQRHKMNYVPDVFHKVPFGSMLLDQESYKFHGESIFHAIRDLVPELNRLVSIIQTINTDAIDASLQLKKPREMIEPNEEVPTVDEVNQPGKINVVPSDGGYFQMPVGELKQQAEIMHQMIQDRINKAGMGFFNAMIDTPMQTATAIISAAQGRDMLIGPRIGTRGLHKQALAEMLIRQVRESGAKVVRLNGQDYEVSKLSGDYDIEFVYTFKDPKIDMARASMAASQRGLIPDKSIRRDTLMRDDPEEDERLLAWEKAARLSPIVDMRRTIVSLLEEADRGDDAARVEAELLCDSQYCPMLEQAILGKPLTPAAEPKPSQPLVPMFGGS